MTSVALIIQARNGSSRLPGKVCEPLVPGAKMLSCLIRRLRASKLVSKCILATTDNTIDNPIADIGIAENVHVFRGSESDVLSRFVGAIQQFPADLVVRICADSPIHDAEIVDQCVKHAIENPHLDYVSNMHPETFPYGLAVEVVPTGVLLRVQENATTPMEREHVTYHIATHPADFCSANVTHESNLSHLRLVVDYPEDLELARRIYSELYAANPLFSWREAVALLQSRPALLAINEMHNDRLPNRPTAVHNDVLAGDV